jgi:cell division protein FtsI/penicillin-binding protein 2
VTRNNAVAVRIRLVCVFFVCAFAAIAYHLYGLQVIKHDELYAKAKSQYTSTKTDVGKRGEIYDFDGNLLVGNIPCSDIIADPQIVGEEKNCREMARFFAKNLEDIDASKLYKKLIKKTRHAVRNGKEVELPNRYALIASKVEWAKSEKLKEAIQERKFKGIVFQETSKRYYPKNEMLANILGFTNIDRDKVIAVIGVEKFFNKLISPTKAKTKYERARDGMPLSYGDRKIMNEVKDGLNVYLTIREPIQAVLEEELDNLVAKWKPRAAYAVLADPYTGNILAIAQRPTYNPNDRNSMNPEAWRNRITEDIFEPGSTMKPIAVAGALDYGVINPDTRFDCEKGLWFYAGKPLRDAHPMEILTVSEIIQKSSNIGTAKIALLMGEKRLYNTLRRFGFGKKTGIPLKPETAGIFRPLKRWDSLSITRFPIGQGIAVSPLQLVRAYCALANGGKLVKLRLVDRVENPSTGKEIKNPIEPAMKVFRNQKAQRQILQMMGLVTQEGGTARKAAIEGYSVGGKTGTSQKVINGLYSHSKFFATFIGFVPVERPAFVLLVTADEPQEAHYGGTVSGPTFKRISERTLKYLDIKPRKLTEYVKN